MKAVDSSRFQPGEGPSRGLLRDYEPSDGTFWSSNRVPPLPPALVATSGALIIPGQGGGGAQLTGEGVTLSPPSHGRSPFSHPGSHFPGGHAAVNHLVVGLMSPLVGWEMRRVGWGCWFIWHRGLGLRPGTLSLLFLSWQLYFGKSDTYLYNGKTKEWLILHIDYLVRKGWHLFLFWKSDTISTQEPS